MADNSKLVGSGMEEKMATQKISVSDHTKGTENSDSFVIDMESFSYGTNKDMTPNSRITLQRSLSRKGSQRGGGSGLEKKMNSNSSVNDRDSMVATTSSPTAAGIGCAGTPDSAATGTADDHCSTTSQVLQITINTSNMDTTSTTTEGRGGFLRRSASRRSSPWGLNPKRILILFASLSSMGTILLIYFTLSISKAADESGMEWQQ